MKTMMNSNHKIKTMMKKKIANKIQIPLMNQVRESAAKRYKTYKINFHHRKILACSAIQSQ